MRTLFRCWAVAAICVLLSPAGASSQSAQQPSAVSPGTPRIGIDVSPLAGATWDRGVTLMEANRVSEAIVFFDRAIKESPTFAFAWSWRALANLRLNRFDDAFKDSQQALKLNPCQSRPYITASFARYQQGKKFDGMKDMKRCEKQDPNAAKQVLSEIVAARVEVEAAGRAAK